MYFYKFLSIDYEEQHSLELTHWKKFTQDELNKMILKSVKHYFENDYVETYKNPCYMDIGDLFYENIIKNQLIDNFGFKEINYENTITYGGEALFSDDFRHKDGVNFKKLLNNVKVPKCKECSKDKCLIENERI